VRPDVGQLADESEALVSNSRVIVKKMTLWTVAPDLPEAARIQVSNIWAVNELVELATSSFTQNR